MVEISGLAAAFPTAVRKPQISQSSPGWIQVGDTGFRAPPPACPQTLLWTLREDRCIGRGQEGPRHTAEASVCTAAGPGRPPGTDPEPRPDIPAHQAQHGRRHQALGSGIGKRLDATQRGKRTEGMSTDSEETEPTCKRLRNRKHPR